LHRDNFLNRRAHRAELSTVGASLDSTLSLAQEENRSTPNEDNKAGDRAASDLGVSMIRIQKISD
jgi:hypothetical protein